MTIGSAGQDSMCPVCNAEAPIDFYSTSLPADIGMLCDSPEEARAAPTGQIDLCFCTQCEFIHNRSFDPEPLSFGPGYEVSLVHSPMFRTFIEGVAQRLIERYDIRNKTVIEIGCGKGEFLTLLCEKGGNKGLGFDPSLSKEWEGPVGEGHIRLIVDYYDERYADISAALICSLSVFEDIQRPVEFLTGVRSLIGARDTKFYLEVFNGARALSTLSSWSINYEQCNYWSQESLVTAFRRSGYEVLDAGQCYGDGEYLYVEAVPAESLDTDVALSSDPLPDVLERFAEHHAAVCKDWRNRLDAFTDDDSRVVVWGTGGKGIGFLNAMPSSAIGRVVDINPDRQNHFTPGSGHRIVGPESLIEYQPNVIILTNPLYADEIKSQVGELDLKCQFLVA